MIGLVIVAHNRALASSLVELIRQVASPELAIAIAAGAGEDHLQFGTDATEIVQAIQTVYSTDGVLVLMDMGSAVLSAELAVELLPEEMKAKIRLCPAPLVEGAIAASVRAGLGCDIATAYAEAQNALQPKSEHLGAIPIKQSTSDIQITTASPLLEAQSATVTLQNQHGLHARPAARFVQLAASFDAQIQVTNITTGKGPVSANSLNSLATLGAVHGHQIRIGAAGPQATMALEALCQLVKNDFRDEAGTQLPVKQEPQLFAKESLVAGALKAIPLSEGIAIGPLFIYQPMSIIPPKYQTEDPEVEWWQLQQALDKTKKAIQKRRQQVRDQLGEAEARIFEAHLLILQDPELLKSVRDAIFQQKWNAATAWKASIDRVIAAYQSLEDAYLRARSADVLDVGNQVLNEMVGQSPLLPTNLPRPSIIYKDDFTPSEVAQLDPTQVLGLIAANGSPTSHGAILARGLGIPALGGIECFSIGNKDGIVIAIDGSKGALWIDPPQNIQNQLIDLREAWLAERKKLLQSSHEPAKLREGKRIEVAANVGGLLDAKSAIVNGADGIGVLRTEFLYLNRTTPPSEQEQLENLRSIGQVMGRLPVIVRTLDVGGDKNLPYIHLPPENNPFLGLRAIRLSLRQPELFLPQLRAILRAGADYDMQVLLPMIAGLEEIIQTKTLLEKAHTQLTDEKLPHRWPIPLGIMIETPSAALLSPQLAVHVDFFSIGTNDLTQYTLAAERGNPELANYLDALNPAVLNLVKKVVDSAHAQGKWTAVCGEIAGDNEAIPVLIGLGVDELSMNPAAIPHIKATIRTIDARAAAILASKSLNCDSAEQVRTFIREG